LKRRNIGQVQLDGLLPDHVLCVLLVSSRQAFLLLQRRMPDADEAHLAPFVARLYEGKTVLGLGELLEELFIDTPIPLVPTR